MNTETIAPAEQFSQADRDRFWSKVSIKSADECWEWKAGRLPFGYGQIFMHGKAQRAPRLALVLSGITVPKGAFVCHHCDNPPCCNPAHLFIGTNKDNALDMCAKGRNVQQQKTHCPNGHPYDDQNVLPSNRGWRACRICSRISQRDHMRRKRALKNRHFNPDKK